MNVFKRFLSMILVLCMLVSVIPMTTLAAETDSTDPTAAETTQETTVTTEETTEATEENMEVTEETTEVTEETTETTEEITEATEETTEVTEETTEATEETTEATEETTVTIEETTEVIEETTEATEDGNLRATFGLSRSTGLTLGDKPEDSTVSGEPFSTSVSANYRIPGLVNHNGTLIASADARWDYEKDGGGMDLVVSRSTDSKTWNYTFAGYLGDNGNVWNADSTTLMDPVIISDGETLYLLADMYPAGYSISSSSTTNTFSDTAIGFDSNGNLLLSADSRSTYGYYLKDGAIYSTDGTQQEDYTVDSWFNLYQNGTYITNLFFSDSPFELRATSYIAMLTSTDDGETWSAPTLLNVKPNGVSWMVLGPGAGLALDGGNIAFTAYDGSNIYLIWGSTANGWNRVSTSAATNESSIIELNDGTIRAFVKRASSNTIAYVDFTYNNGTYTAGSLVDTGVTNFSQCMVSSLHYSKTLNGQEVVLVCCPSKPNSGAWNGRFNGKIHMFTLDDSNAMTLVGSYALNGESDFFAYSNMAEMNDGTIAVLYEDDCISYSAGNYTGDASHITYTSVNLETAFGVTLDEEVTTAVLTDEVNNTGVQVALTNVDTTGWTMNVTPNQTVAGLIAAAYVAYDVTITKADGSYYTDPAEVTLPLGEMAGKNNIYPFIVETDGTVTKIEEYELDDNGNIIFTAPHFSVMGVAEDAADTVDGKTVDITLYVGDDKTVTIDGASYDSDDVTASPNASIANIAGIEAKSILASKELVAVSEVESGKQYLLVNNRAGKTLTGTTNSPGLLLDGTASVDSTHLWTIEASGDNHTVRYGTAGGYLNVGYGSASLTSSAVTLQLDYIEASGHWLINDNQGWYGLNDYTGSATIAAGWGNASTDDGSWWTIYEIVETEASTYTAVTFTGVAEGTTTATIGNVTYNITVKAISEGDISDFNNIIGEDSYSDNNSNATHRSDLDMAGKVITKLTISENASFNLNVDVTDYESIKWSVADTSIATVDENGVVTAVKEGETTVTATVIKNGKKESISIPVVVKPSLVESSSNVVPIFFYIEQVDHTTPYYTMFLSTGDDAVLKNDYTMVPVIEGEVIWIERPQDSALGWVWTATPDGDHALVYMASTGSVSQYYPLKNTDGTLGESDYNSTTSTNPGAYYKNSISYKNIVSVGSDAGETNWKTVLDTHLTTSINQTYNCDGAMSNTRWDHDEVPKLVSSMTFISDPVPTIDKTVDGILPTTRLRADYRRYTDGMVASVGELVYFKITVTLKRPTVWADEENGIGAITYSNSIVSDTVLDDAYIYAAASDTNNNGTIESGEGQQLQTQDITDKLNAAWGADEQTRTIELYLVYQITTEDIPKFVIDNVASLNTNFHSEYSTGVSARKADAKASITVVGRAMDNIVIDFGQKVQITGLTDDYLKGVYTGEMVKYSAKYGTVEITKNDDGTYVVTYTPTSILQGTDAVWLYGLGVDENNNQVEKIINGFIVYPATTVYYEEGFIFNDNSTGWDLTNSAKATMVQEYEPLGKSNYDSGGTLTSKTSGKVHEYGYDGIYDGSKTGSGRSYAVSSTSGAATSFTFTGTGFELYANSNSASGYVTVYSQGELSKLYMINTELSGSETDGDVTNDQQDDANGGDTYYSLPVISETDLPYGTYTVQLKQTNGTAPIYIDGVRIINTLEDSTVFTIDEEDNPIFYELRDYVLNAIGVENLNKSDYIDSNDRVGMVDAVKDMAGQVYTALGDGTKAVVINTDGTTFTTDQAQDLLDNGPKNELYLYQGQTLAFSVSTDRVLQLGLKTPTGSAEFTLTVDGTDHTLSSLISTVDMFYKIAEKGGTSHTVSITVSEGVLSVTDLKVCDDPNFTFNDLTQEDIETALLGTYGLLDEDVSAEDETPTEPETEPTEPSKPGKPDKNEKPGRNNKADETVQNENTATLNIVFVNLFGKKVGTATITETWTSNGNFRISASEIAAEAPDGLVALRLNAVTLKSGKTTTIVVPVI